MPKTENMIGLFITHPGLHPNGYVQADPIPLSRVDKQKSSFQFLFIKCLNLTTLLLGLYST